MSVFNSLCLVGLAAGMGPGGAAASTGQVERVAAIEPASGDARAGSLEPAETIAVLILSTAASGYPLSEVYAAVRGPLERHTALQVAPLETIGIEERDVAIRECAGDASCFVRRLRAARDGVDLLLTVSVDRPSDSVLLGLRLIDTRQETEVGATGDEIPIGTALERAFERRLAEVVPRSMWGQVAALYVESDLGSAEASIGGRSCVTPCLIERLWPGAHEVVVRAPGLFPWRETVELEPGQTTRVSVGLRAPEPPLYERPWFWVAVGAGLVAGIVGGYFLLQPSEREVVVCFARDPSSCDGG